MGHGTRTKSNPGKIRLPHRLRFSNSRRYFHQLPAGPSSTVSTSVWSQTKPPRSQSKASFAISPPKPQFTPWHTHTVEGNKPIRATCDSLTTPHGRFRNSRRRPASDTDLASPELITPHEMVVSASFCSGIQGPLLPDVMVWSVIGSAVASCADSGGQRMRLRRPAEQGTKKKICRLSVIRNGRR